LLIPAHFANQKDGVEHHPGDNQSKEYDSEEQQDHFAPVQDDPADVEGNRQCNQAYSQAEEEHDCSAAARDSHRLTLILPFPEACHCRRRPLNHTGHEGYFRLLGAVWRPPSSVASLNFSRSKGVIRITYTINANYTMCYCTVTASVGDDD